MKRKLILGLLLAGSGGVVYTHHTEILNLLKTLARGHIWWILAAVGLQIIYYVFQALVYKHSFRTVDVDSSAKELLPTVAGSLFLNVVAPLGGASGTALFIDDTARRGESAARGAVGTMLARTMFVASLGLLLIGGFIYLSLHHILRAYQIAGAAVLGLKLAILSGILLLGLWWPGLLRGLFRWVQIVLNRVAEFARRDPFLGDDWHTRNADQYIGAAVSMRENRSQLLRALGMGLAMQVVNLVSLYAVFLAFGQVISIGALIAGFAVGLLFWMISPAAEGAGVVESLMSVVFISLGVPALTATAVVFAFRGLTLWLPCIIGFLLLGSLPSFKPAAPAVPA